MLNNYNIFYADDDIDDLNIFVDAAYEVSSSLQVITQENGEDLIRNLNNPTSQHNLVFLDLNMPMKNGYEILKEIKQSAHTKDLPVIIFSTTTDVNAIHNTRMLGANYYIPKPSTFVSLKNAIKHCLSINWETFMPKAEEFVYRS
jgi:DNA-binding response OmpR family regulator